MRTSWTLAATAILFTLLIPTPARQSRAETVSAERNAIDSLPPCSALHDARERVEGKPAEPYMEAMQGQSVQRAFLELHSTRSHSGPTDIRVVLHLYFSQFDGPGSLVTDETTRKKIRDSGLEATLDDLAKARVSHAPVFARHGLRRRDHNLYSYVEFFATPEFVPQRTVLSPIGASPQEMPHAAYVGDVAGLSRMLEGRRYDTNQLNMAMLIAAQSRYDNGAVISLLIKAGADVNARGDQGTTPLMVSVTSPCNLKALLERGARITDQDNDGKTAEAIARKEGLSRSVQLLEEARSHARSTN